MQLQEVQNQLARQIKEEGEMQKKLKKEREIQEKAQQKYSNWLKKKNQEKMELEKKEKVRWTLNIFVLLLTTIYLSTPILYLQENTTRYVSFISGQEKATLKEDQDQERRKKAGEKFKEWLAKANEKGRDSPKTPSFSTSRNILHF